MPGAARAHKANSASVRRVKTGIKGFDELVNGGFPESSSVLVTGSPGTGKTIFGLQYIYNGAKHFKEKGLYVTFEQTEDSMKNQAKLFGWDIESLIKSKQIQIIYIPVKSIDHNTAKMIATKVNRDKIRRLVIDSVSTLAVNAPVYTFMRTADVIDVSKGHSIVSPPVMGQLVVRRFIYNFIDYIRSMGKCTTLLIAEAPDKGEYLSRDTVSEFVCDGIVFITFESMGGEFSRSLIVRKMRHTKNDEDVHPLEISDKEGLVVHNISK